MKYLVVFSIVLIVIMNSFVGYNVCHNELSLASIFKMSTVEAEQNNSDDCIQKSTTVVEEGSCIDSPHTTGKMKSTHWCDGGTTGTCRNGEYSAFWYCNGQCRVYDYTTKDPCGKK